MPRANTQIRTAVEREGSAKHVRLTLLSFAVTVAVTRLYLTLTGFPQIGNGTLHIAHLLWGGLVLFSSALLMLLYSNRWVYTLGSILAGIGMGLFMDEVGKFITRTNNYFFAPAAPIIYTLFLLIILLYLEVRRKPKRDARSELYRVFDMLQEVLDRDLEAPERRALKSRLNYVITLNEDPDLTRLAQGLLDFVESKSTSVVRHKAGWLDRLEMKWRAFEQRRLTRPRLKAVLVAALGVLGVWAAADWVELMKPVSTALHMETPLAHLIAAGRVIGPKSLDFYLAGVVVKASCGLAMLIGAGLLAGNRDKLGIRLSYLGLLLWVTLVNLVEFYFDQFSTIVPAAIEFGLLMVLLEYRGRVAPEGAPET